MRHNLSRVALLLILGGCAPDKVDPRTIHSPSWGGGAPGVKLMGSGPGKSGPGEPGSILSSTPSADAGGEADSGRDAHVDVTARTDVDNT